jgi:hypothetical protein
MAVSTVVNKLKLVTWNGSDQVFPMQPWKHQNAPFSKIRHLSFGVAATVCSCWVHHQTSRRWWSLSYWYICSRPWPNMNE